MKQTLLMIAMTLVGTFGTVFFDPFLGVFVYYLYAVLRPQFIWEWSLPVFAWSFYVAIATIIALFLGDTSRAAPRFSFAHRSVVLFGCWIGVTYFTAVNPDVAYPFLVEYLKLFVFFVVAARIVGTVKQVWALYLMVAGTLGYIAYEMNAIYLFQGGYLYIYRRGFGGLDNNGAALMIAMGVPLCFFAWEGIRKWYRWVFMALILPIIHAVLMSYSRGAMVSLIAATPLLMIRCRHRIQLAFLAVGLAFLIPVMAGKEIQARFFTISNADADGSANSRLTSWAIAWRMAKENPVFGLGIRNSNLFTYAYGADLNGRTIHSQYLQTAADSGLVALGLYLLMLVSVWFSLRRARKMVAGRKDPEAMRIYGIACGIEVSMVVFCVGAVFLSLENFELPYVLMLIGAQLPVVVQATETERENECLLQAHRGEESGAPGVLSA